MLALRAATDVIIRKIQGRGPWLQGKDLPLLNV